MDRATETHGLRAANREPQERECKGISRAGQLQEVAFTSRGQGHWIVHKVVRVATVGINVPSTPSHPTLKPRRERWLSLPPTLRASTGRHFLHQHRDTWPENRRDRQEVSCWLTSVLRHLRRGLRGRRRGTRRPERSLPNPNHLVGHLHLRLTPRDRNSPHVRGRP